MKIVNLDGYSTNPGDLSWDWLEKYGESVVYERTKPDEIIERAKDADCLIINKSQITAQILDNLPKLKYVGLQSTGYNAIDCKAAKEKGIIVSNIPSYSTNEVAQHVFALILEITNHVALHSQAVHDCEWSTCPDFCFWKSPLEELNNKTIGIIGFGSIGKRVAKIAQAFGMKVFINNPHPAENDYSEYRFCSLNELLTKSDIITCHCPLNENTINLINKDTISKMKRTAIFINTSRGQIVDDKALAFALNNNMIKAVGLDVLSEEPPKRSNPLLTAKNCYITPHIAWAAVETRTRLIKTLEENLKAFTEGKPQNVVNM